MASIHPGLTTLPRSKARRAAGRTKPAAPIPDQNHQGGVRDNICTYFNLVFLVLAVMLALVLGSIWGFWGLCSWNTGIVQQLRAKRPSTS